MAYYWEHGKPTGMIQNMYCYCSGADRRKPGRSIYDFFLPIAQEKRIDFTIGRCDTVTAMADKTRIQQLINSLVDNALKFTPGDGSVELCLESQEDTILFRVRDSGIGIPEEEMENIFKRFYQVDKARSGEERGAGLGLQICKRIAEAHGGQISVQANKDRGVTFTVTLPVKGCCGGSGDERGN